MYICFEQDEVLNAIIQLLHSQDILFIILVWRKYFHCVSQHLFYQLEYFCQIWIVEEVMLGGEWFSVSERKAGVFIPSISKNYGHTWARGKRLNNRLSFLSTKPTRNVWREQEMYKKEKGIFPPDNKAAFGDLPLLVTFMWSIKFR